MAIKYFPLQPAHEGKNKGKYISIHYKMALGALKNGES
jgi:hypothetical protein